MIWILLFMIGTRLDMGTSYWVVFCLGIAWKVLKAMLDSAPEMEDK